MASGGDVITYFPSTLDDYYAAEEHFPLLERGEGDLGVEAEDAQEEAKEGLVRAMKIVGGPVMVDARRGDVFALAVYDGENEHLIVRTGDHAREEALHRAREHLDKTSLAYHSQFHGGVAKEKA